MIENKVCSVFSVQNTFGRILQHLKAFSMKNSVWLCSTAALWERTAGETYRNHHQLSAAGKSAEVMMTRQWFSQCYTQTLRTARLLFLHWFQHTTTSSCDTLLSDCCCNSSVDSQISSSHYLILGSRSYSWHREGLSCSAAGPAESSEPSRQKKRERCSQKHCSYPTHGGFKKKKLLLSISTCSKIPGHLLQSLSCQSMNYMQPQSHWHCGWPIPHPTLRTQPRNRFPPADVFSACKAKPLVGEARLFLRLNLSPPPIRPHSSTVSANSTTLNWALFVGSVFLFYTLKFKFTFNLTLTSKTETEVNFTA